MHYSDLLQLIWHNWNLILNFILILILMYVYGSMVYWGAIVEKNNQVMQIMRNHFDIERTSLEMRIRELKAEVSDLKDELINERKAWEISWTQQHIDGT